MSTLDVEIVTPARQAWTGKATGVQLPAWLGEAGVLPQHAAMLALTRAGLVTITGDSALRFVVGTGFAEVGPDRVTLLVDSCENAADIDLGQAQREVEAASKALAAAAPGSAEALTAARKLELAHVKVAAKG